MNIKDNKLICSFCKAVGSVRIIKFWIPSTSHEPMVDISCGACWAKSTVKRKDLKTYENTSNT